MTSGGHHYHYRNRSGGRIAVVALAIALAITLAIALAIGVALGFAMGALAERLFLLGEGWHTTFEEGVYPLSFVLAIVVLAIAGVCMGGFLLLAAERQGDLPGAWRALGVFVASSVLAALVFWGASSM
jgi:hypothetical protein